MTSEPLTREKWHEACDIMQELEGLVDEAPAADLRQIAPTLLEGLMKPSLRKPGYEERRQAAIDRVLALVNAKRAATSVESPASEPAATETPIQSASKALDEMVAHLADLARWAVVDFPEEAADDTREAVVALGIVVVAPICLWLASKAIAVRKSLGENR